MGDARIGTTGRGIGPAYEDKVARRAIRLGDLADDAVVGDKLDVLLVHHNALLRGLGMPEIDRDSVLDELRAIAPKVLPYADTVWKTLDEARRAGKRILFEGAQGTMLDIDHGTIRSSPPRTLAGQAAAGSGLGRSPQLRARYHKGLHHPRRLRACETGRLIGERGREFGTVTGRARRCGWFDAVLVRQAVKVNGISGIALTKLDVLDGFPKSTCASAIASTARHWITFPPRRSVSRGSNRCSRRWRLVGQHAGRPLLGRPASRPPSSIYAVSRR